MDNHNPSDGTYDIEFTKEYFYGSYGLPVQTQKKYDDSNHKTVKGTINQPEKLNCNKPKFKSFNAVLTPTN